jgi:hypothetical protein
MSPDSRVIRSATGPFDASPTTGQAIAPLALAAAMMGVQSAVTLSTGVHDAVGGASEVRNFSRAYTRFLPNLAVSDPVRTPATSRGVVSVRLSGEAKFLLAGGRDGRQPGRPADRSVAMS